MKKLQTTLLMLLISISTTAQTKEETIQWLNDYGTKLLKTKSKEYTYSDSEGKTGTVYFTFRFNGFDGEYLNFSTSESQPNFDRDVNYKVKPDDIYFQDQAQAEIESYYYPSYVLNYSDYKIQDSVKMNIVKIKTEVKTVSYKLKSFNFRNNKEGEAEDNTTDISVHFLDPDKENVYRVLKAIMNLAKLSGAKPLPAVTNNTF